MSGVTDAPETELTREQWLNVAARMIRDEYGEIFSTHFGQVGLEHLNHLHISAGFPSRGGLTKVIGECWKSKASADEVTHHIFINPRLTGTVEVLATLAHEMIHAADDGEHGHKGPFVKAARGMDLQGKATATVAGEGFEAWVDSVADALGTYPHVGLVPLSVKKKQSTRMLKLEAACCGYVVRTTRKWLDVGLPSCPCGNRMEEDLPEGWED